MGSDRELRRTFDGAAASYHEARPPYPDLLFDDLIGMLPTEPMVLEIGPGTGKATEPLLERGARVRAVEIGPRLAVQLAQRLGDRLESGDLEVIVADYEQLEPDGSRFDAIVCATAYHWISADQQLARPPQWLTPGGRLAVIDTMQIASDVDDGYFDAAAPIYERHGHGGDHRELPTPDEVASPIWERMVAEPGCTDVTLARYRSDQRYDAAGYRALLNTYSGMLALPHAAREALVDDLVSLVDDRGGVVVRPLVITLATCRFAD